MSMVDNGRFPPRGNLFLAVQEGIILFSSFRISAGQFGLSEM